MLRLPNQYDAWSLWDPRKGSVASNLGNLSLGFKVKRCVKLQQNETVKRTSNELLEISKDSNESLGVG